MTVRASPRSHTTRAILATLLLAMVLPMVCSCPYATLPLAAPLAFNFHVLDDGRAYRSSQPNADQLRAMADLYGIKTVVNLRGTNTGLAWYDEERDACDELGIPLVDLAMSARRLPAPELLAAILDTLRSAEYPILIHCQAGADRTGAISAIYRIAILGDSREDALAELSPQYFHFTPVTPCMDKIAEIFEPDPAWLDTYADQFPQLICDP
jgi:protein tyrosine/serine phosphatase